MGDRPEESKLSQTLGAISERVSRMQRLLEELQFHVSNSFRLVRSNLPGDPGNDRSLNSPQDNSFEILEALLNDSPETTAEEENYANMLSPTIESAPKRTSRSKRKQTEQAGYNAQKKKRRKEESRKEGLSPPLSGTRHTPASSSASPSNDESTAAGSKGDLPSQSENPRESLVVKKEEARQKRLRRRETKRHLAIKCHFRFRALKLYEEAKWEKNGLRAVISTQRVIDLNIDLKDPVKSIKKRMTLRSFCFHASSDGFVTFSHANVNEQNWREALFGFR